MPLTTSRFRPALGAAPLLLALGCGARSELDLPLADGGAQGVQIACTMTAGTSTQCLYEYSEWPEESLPLAKDCAAGFDSTLGTTCSTTGLVGCFVRTITTPYTTIVAQCYYAPETEAEAQTLCSGCGPWQTTLPTP